MFSGPALHLETFRLRTESTTLLTEIQKSNNECRSHNYLLLKKDMLKAEVGGIEGQGAGLNK